MLRAVCLTFFFSLCRSCGRMAQREGSVPQAEGSPRQSPGQQWLLWDQSVETLPGVRRPQVKDHTHSPYLSRKEPLVLDLTLNINWTNDEKDNFLCFWIGLGQWRWCEALTFHVSDLILTGFLYGWKSNHTLSFQLFLHTDTHSDSHTRTHIWLDPITLPLYGKGE